MIAAFTKPVVKASRPNCCLIAVIPNAIEEKSY